MEHPTADALIQRFQTRAATVGVVGLGYVGLPLVRAMHDAGFHVVGFDIDAGKVEMLQAGESYLKHLGPGLVQALAHSDRFTPTDDPELLRGCDAIAICVPTPLGPHLEPDLSFVRASVAMVARVLKPGALVSLESTTYPGTTREVCLPILEGWDANALDAPHNDSNRQPDDDAGEAAEPRLVSRDFFLVFSPEREDPGRTGVDTRTIPRLVGGVDEQSTRVGVALYSAAIENVIAVESAEVAEAAKLLENIYRSVNIALVNELKPVLTDMGIDIWQVIRAAATKPFGFQPFYPGPGLGGHCIPIDPYYLTYKAREYGHVTRFIELAGEINHHMPRYVVDRVAEALNGDKKAVRGSRVLVMGIAYKPNVDDIRETPAAEVIHLLLERGAEVSYHDPHVSKFPEMRHYSIEMESVALTAAAVSSSDCVVIVTDHKEVDYALLGSHARLIVDTRDAMAKVAGVTARVVKA